MFNAIQGVNYNAWSEVLCLFLYMERSIALVVIHGVKLYAQCYTRSEAICSLLYKE